MNAEQLFFSLIRHRVFGEAFEGNVPESLAKELFLLAKKHDLAHIIKPSTVEGEGREKFRKEEILALVRRDKSDYEMGEITRIFKEEKIEFLPLKGAVISAFYPERYMRTSCDIDVLVKENDLPRAISALTEKLGYSGGDRREYHDVSLYSKSGVHLELHFNILENTENIDRLLSKVWEHTKDGRMENEFLIFHTLAHMSYHFLHGGCGVKPFIDLKLLLDKTDYDKEKLDCFLQETDLAHFFEAVVRLIGVWFEGKVHDDVTLEVEKYILEGGVYGNKLNQIAVAKEKKGGRLGFILSRLFLPYDAMARYYPILKKHKWLLPFYYIVRFARLLSPKVLRRSAGDLKVSGEISDEKADRVKRLLSEIGL